MNQPQHEADPQPHPKLDQLAVRMGIRITEPNRDRLVGTMPVVGNQQASGRLHGGASAVLAETLGSVAAARHAADQDRVALGLELSCSHHRGVFEGLVTAVVTPLHLGRTLSTFEIVITDERGARICTARLSCALRAKGGEG
ncbi:hotdog fold thioesterase [Streptomyces sp. NBC_01233]|uniref:hotdog fold thioesterase n=1 Tax=Streptomyces sp. NBC_01233 TaxID=2903787 RepID=UPI002E0E1AF8|nr:hotdog fold thioesterase [Streptomyces sp. NBC_01233]